MNRELGWYRQDDVPMLWESAKQCSISNHKLMMTRNARLYEQTANTRKRGHFISRFEEKVRKDEKPETVDL